MVVIHLGDLHFGKNLAEYSLIEDQHYILNQILDIIDEKNVWEVYYGIKGLHGRILFMDVFGRI